MYISRSFTPVTVRDRFWISWYRFTLTGIGWRWRTLNQERTAKEITGGEAAGKKKSASFGGWRTRRVKKSRPLGSSPSLISKPWNERRPWTWKILTTVSRRFSSFFLSALIRVRVFYSHETSINVWYLKVAFVNKKKSFSGKSDVFYVN